MSINVAPLAGSVDRNANALEPRLCGDLSLPSRGAWIEISLWAEQATFGPGRSPHGERG